MLHEHIRIKGGGMKKLVSLSSAVFIFTFVITASAAELFLNPGEQHQIEDTTVYCLSGDGDGDPIEVVSSVDLECIKTLHDDHFPGFPSWDDVIIWASEDCRTAPLDQYRCVVIKSTFNKSCYDDLTRDHNGSPGFPTNNVLRAIQDACKDVVFNCWY